MSKTLIATVLMLCISTSLQFKQCPVKKPFGKDKLFVGYLGSWNENYSTTGTDTIIANLPAYVNVLNIGFVYPDLDYQGNLDLTGVGLEFVNTGPVVKMALDTLKARNPNTKIFLSVGGGTYGDRWVNFKEDVVAQFVNDFGFDGVDVDYEIGDPECSGNNEDITCKSDAGFIDAITRMRAVLPKSKLLSVATMNVGAYGQGDFLYDTPISSYTGSSVNVLKKAGKHLDLVNVMSYDAGEIDAVRAMMAHKSIFSGKVVAGIEVAPEAWGDHVYTMDKVEDVADAVMDGKGDGVMLWSLGKVPEGTVSRDNPNAEMIAQGVCEIFLLKDCEKSLLVTGQQ